MHPSLFGTDGIRRRVGDEPLSSASLPQLGASIARWIQEQHSHPHIVIAHDGRQSAPRIKDALLHGLMSFPVTIIDADLQPTPVVCNLVQRQQKFDLGIIISASHNTYEDNGIKLVTRHGKLTPEDETAITRSFYTQRDLPSLHPAATVSSEDISEAYLADVTTLFPSLALSNKQIVIDCAHGAMSYLAPRLLSKFGCTALFINHEPNGTNINAECGATHPAALQEAVRATRADLGFAFDGDSDRIVTVGPDGSVKDGDDILALLLTHPSYATTPGVVGTIMSNQGLEAHLAHSERALLRTSVGDKYVVEALTKTDFMLGGEPSGHVIMRDYMLSGDGLYTALKIMETCMLTDTWNLMTFTRYPQVLINVPVAHKKDLSAEPFAALIRESEECLTSGRLIARYSGTENLLRIMVEDASFDHAQRIGSQLADQLRRELSHLQ